MLTKQKDKMIKPEEVRNKEIEQEYFFSGGTEYLPQTIKAISREEAEKIWLLERKKVAQQTKIE